MIREGLIEGLVFGSKKGINYWESSPPPTETIYDQVNSGEIDEFIRNAIGSGVLNDYAVMDIGPYTFNDLSGGFVNNDCNNRMQSQGGATDTASPHGRAVVADGLTKYWTDENASDDFVFGNNPFAIAVRIKVTASAPIASTAIMGKGSAMNNYYIGAAFGTGNLFFTAKVFGAPPTAFTSTSITDNTYHWVLFGRTVTSEKIWVRIAADSGETAFPGTNDLSNATVPFGIWAPLGSGVGLACEVDHMLAWIGTAAENVYTNQAALVTEVFND